MTVADLIDTLSRNIRGQWYADDVRAYKRDERAIMRAIARYGYECHNRGWEFQPHAIQRDILALLQDIKRTGAEVKYLPLYLEGAIARHIGQRSEELQAGAIRAARHIKKIVEGAEKVEVIRELGACETLGMIYRDLKRRRPKPRAKQPRERQETLL